MNKKWLIRGIVITGVFISTLMIVAPAMAMWDWCDVDPVLNIGGHTVNLNAYIQGDPQQVRGDIVFTVSVPSGTQINIVSSEPNATVNIKYYGWLSFFKYSRCIPVDVDVDINARTTFNTKLVVTVDGQQVSQDQGNTRGDLDCYFIIH